MTDYFKNFATPKKFIAVDASASNRFSVLQSDYPDLILFHWPKQKPDREVFEQLVNIGIEQRRNHLLIAGCSVEQSCLVISLLALGRGFDVYLCNDLIDGPAEERTLLIERLRQHGAIVVTQKQVVAEFDMSVRHNS